jgi:hypothetical protein
MKYRVIKKKGKDYRVLAWWISASRALRDPRRDKGLPPWNMTPPEDKSNLLFRFLHPLFQALKPIKHTQTWARRRGARPQEATSKQKQGKKAAANKKRNGRRKLFWFGFVGK